MRNNVIVIALLAFVACSKPSQQTTEQPSETKPTEVPNDVQIALQRNTCLACHKLDRKLIGPSYVDIAQKMQSADEIISLIRNPVPSHWPDYPPMVGIKVNEEDGKLIANWILGLKKGTD